MARAQPFDFVITDLHMPELDGWGLLPMLAQLQLPPRVIVMTAHGEDEQERVRKTGGWACVDKSFLIEGIKETLKAAQPE
jgi:CheY-like chemotaxis protein